MTKREIEKCENLMHEAIRYAKESKEELEKAMSEKDKTEREILHSKGVQHYGYKVFRIYHKKHQKASVNLKRSRGYHSQHRQKKEK